MINRCLLLVIALLGIGPSASAADQTAAATESWSPYTLFRKPPQMPRMVVDGFLWIEAEDFADYGDWRLDTQFVQQMGSAYLIAAGVGRPIADAVTEVEIPKAGNYRLWVRAKNWIKDYAPGKFAVSIGAKPSAHVFGTAATQDWVWENGGNFALPAGKVKLALHDLTGYFGRCDALLLTTDLNYVPPQEEKRLAEERSRLSGISREPKAEGRFDVVVVGGGAAGCCAAIASARLGADTALVQDRPVLGGNSSDELGVGIAGASVNHPNARESGIIEEAGRVQAHGNFMRMSEAFRIVAGGQKRLRIFYNRRVIDARHDQQHVAEVTAVDTLSGRLSSVGGKIFIDCTGDGWVGYYAGAKYRAGRESREEFGEDLAPPQADAIMMSGCVMGDYTTSFRAKSLGHPVAYAAPPWAAKLPPPAEFGRKIPRIDSGDWWMEHSGDIDNLWEPERARDELLKISFGYWDFLKNRWPERETARNFALAFVPFMNGRRESRRLMGDYIFKQQDAQNATLFPDRIGYGGWPLDVHHARGIFSGKEGPFHCDAAVPIYSIPYRILYSVNIANLLFAGRDVSTTHIGLGTLRVQGTTSVMGQAAGTAAALCLRHGCTPRELGRTYITELQQTLLKHDQYIPELKNEDPRDLVQGATVAASSTATFEEFRRENVKRQDGHPLNMARAMMVPRGVGERVESVYALLYSQDDKPVELTLHVREAAAAEDFSAARDLATAKATLAPGRLAWVKFPVNCRAARPYLWFWLGKTARVSWCLMVTAPRGSCRAYGNDGRHWKVHSGQYYACYTDPPVGTVCDYRPENVQNGVSRSVGTATNMWASDSRQPLPQWIEVTFPRPARLNTVYLTFDTDLNNRRHDRALVQQCVKDYRLEFYDGHRWRELVSVSDNYQRRRVHHFTAVVAEKLRLTVTATGGDRSARVFEIRAYEEPSEE